MTTPKLSPKAWILLGAICETHERSPAGYSIPKPNGGPAKSLEQHRLFTLNEYGNAIPTAEGKAANLAHFGPRTSDMVRVHLDFTIKLRGRAAESPFRPEALIAALGPALAAALETQLGVPELLALEVSSALDFRRLA